MKSCYQFMVSYVAEKLSYPLKLMVGSSSNYEAAFSADLSFICGLPYVLRTSPRLRPSPIEAIAAPVLKGERYRDQPIYFSDVIVHASSAFQTFEDLRGGTWAYNEPESQSGYGITRYHLVKKGSTKGFFSQIINAGFHQKAIRLVGNKKVDGAAIDSQTLAIELRSHPGLARKLRVIDSLGPSTIQPIVVNSRLPSVLKQEIQSVLVEMHSDPQAKQHFDFGFIDRLVKIEDSVYDDIRDMLSACEQANFLALQ